MARSPTGAPRGQQREPAPMSVSEAMNGSPQPKIGLGSTLEKRGGTLPNNYARSMRISKFFNMLLRAAQRTDQKFMCDLVLLFQESPDIDGFVDLSTILDFFCRSTFTLDINILMSIDKYAIDIPEIQMPASCPTSFFSDIAFALELSVNDALLVDDFMLEYLGRAKHDVELHLYDVTEGIASMLGSLMALKGLDGIWHSSVVAYGKEYFWSQSLRYDEPGSTVWGQPTKCLHMGSTWFKENEFINFIVHQVHPVFTKEAYDVLTFNCNHCSDRLIRWLTGNTVPDEVIHQAQRLMGDKNVAFIQPWVNRLNRGESMLTPEVTTASC